MLFGERAIPRVQLKYNRFTVPYTIKWSSAMDCGCGAIVYSSYYSAVQSACTRTAGAGILAILPVEITVVPLLRILDSHSIDRAESPTANS